MNLVFTRENAIDWGAVARQIEDAETGAVADAAAAAVAEGRANIAAAGFSARWQAALRSKLDPSRHSALIFHSIPFAGVFEHGARIGGNPLLWLPIEANLPEGIRSPRKYQGRLVSVNVAGKPPLLFDAGNRRIGPLFVGVRAVTIRKRFDLYRIFARVADRLGEFYEQRIKG